MPRATKPKKIFVLDTSVLLYDYDAVKNFQKNDIAIPITVLEELDTQSNGLSYLVDRMQGNDLYAHINLKKGERSELANLASRLL